METKLPKTDIVPDRAFPTIGAVCLNATISVIPDQTLGTTKSDNGVRARLRLDPLGWYASIPLGMMIPHNVTEGFVTTWRHPLTRRPPHGMMNSSTTKGLITMRDNEMIAEFKRAKGALPLGDYAYDQLVADHGIEADLLLHGAKMRPEMIKDFDQRTRVLIMLTAHYPDECPFC